MYWNMVLDETGKSGWDWSQNSLVRVNRQTHEVVYTDEYYLLKHLSHFVQPGSRRLKVSASENMLAFRNHEGKVVVVVYHPGAAPMNKTVRIGDMCFVLALSPQSLATVVCS